MARDAWTILCLFCVHSRRCWVQDHYWPMLLCRCAPHEAHSTQGSLASDTALWCPWSHTYNTHDRCQMMRVGPRLWPYGSCTTLNIHEDSQLSVYDNGCQWNHSCHEDLQIVGMRFIYRYKDQKHRQLWAMQFQDWAYTFSHGWPNKERGVVGVGD